MYTVGNTCYATVNVMEKLGIDSPSNDNCLIMNYIMIIDTAHMAMPLEDNSCYAGTLRLQSSLRGIKYLLCTCEKRLEYFIESEPSMRDSLHMYATIEECFV